MRRFFTSTGLSESENAIVEDPNDPIYDPDQEQEVVNNNNRENNLHWDYVDTTNRERPHIADNSVNILVVGDKNVGKTALIDQYANGMSQTTAQTTRQKQIISEGKTITLNITECNDETFSSLLPTAHGVLVVFDVTANDTYTHVNNYLQKIRQHSKYHLAIIIVGNKIDDTLRDVAEKTAEEFAMQTGFRYFETSAQQGTQVDATFTALLRGVHERFTL